MWPARPSCPDGPSANGPSTTRTHGVSASETSSVLRSRNLPSAHPSNSLPSSKTSTGFIPSGLVIYVLPVVANIHKSKSTA